ncbi:MAG: potassium channel family protein [Planctomycetota bacterium]
MPTTESSAPLPPALAHGGLLVVIVHVFVSAYTLQDPTSVAAVATQTLFYAILVTIFVGVNKYRLEAGLWFALISVATVVRIVFAPEDRLAQAAADGALLCCGTLVVVKSIRRMLNTPAVTPALISAAVTTYLLAGIIWTIGFHAIETMQPGSFRVSGRATEVSAGDLSYFSFVTLTTLGNGDVSPTTAFARSVATLEAVFGQIFLVVLLGRLVSLQIASSRPRRPSPNELLPTNPEAPGTTQ